MDQDVLQQLTTLISNSEDQTEMMRRHRRDMFAAQALLGLIPHWSSEKYVCQKAVEYADLMIKELDK